ncbi:MAG: hypothetical protein EU541_00235, partial [Promethearchaeota archaeon]
MIMEALKEYFLRGETAISLSGKVTPYAVKKEIRHLLKEYVEEPSTSSRKKEGYELIEYLELDKEVHKYKIEQGDLDSLVRFFSDYYKHGEITDKMRLPNFIYSMVFKRSVVTGAYYKNPSYQDIKSLAEEKYGYTLVGKLGFWLEQVFTSKSTEISDLQFIVSKGLDLISKSIRELHIEYVAEQQRLYNEIREMRREGSHESQEFQELMDEIQARFDSFAERRTGAMMAELTGIPLSHVVTKHDEFQTRVPVTSVFQTELKRRYDMLLKLKLGNLMKNLNDIGILREKIWRDLNNPASATQKNLGLETESDHDQHWRSGKEFLTCKYLLFEIPEADIEDYSDIESIDAAINRYGKEHKLKHELLDPETEFWGHCSNLQAWTENSYDTRLLDKRLAFPLLWALADEGDPQAKKAFKEEIARRLENGTPTVRTYLLREGYLEYLTEEELDTITTAWVKYKGERIPVIKNSLFL